MKTKKKHHNITEKHIGPYGINQNAAQNNAQRIHSPGNITNQKFD